MEASHYPDLVGWLYRSSSHRGHVRPAVKQLPYRKSKIGTCAKKNIIQHTFTLLPLSIHASNATLPLSLALLQLQRKIPTITKLFVCKSSPFSVMMILDYFWSSLINFRLFPTTSNWLQQSCLSAFSMSKHRQPEWLQSLPL